MKGLQGERLRQAFKYLDDNQDGFIRPEQFRQIIVVCSFICFRQPSRKIIFLRNWLDINYRMR
jgi:Ca2+-binding EF-hand superfamily protein